MSVVEREVRVVRTIKGARAIAERMQRDEAFTGQRYVARAIDAGKFAVILIDGGVVRDAPTLSFKGGRGVEREDAFAIGQGRRSFKHEHTGSRVFA